MKNRVKERKADLQKANEELESISYSVSHDLNAPLRKVNLFVQRYFSNEHPLMDQQGRETLMTVTRNIEKMRLIEDLLNFSRLIRKL